MILFECIMLSCSYGCMRNQRKSQIPSKNIATKKVADNMKNIENERKLLLAKSGFKFPSMQDFQSKIKKIFGYDIKEKTSDIIEVEFNPLIEDEPDNLIIYRKDRFVDLNTHSEVYDDKLYLLAFNNYRRIQRANALHRKVIKSFRKNTQKEYKNLIFLLVED